MTKEEAAAALDGNEYGQEGTPELFAEMKSAGLVALFGYSDDNIELRGAVHDEVGAYGGTEIAFTSAGLLVNECEEDCPYFAKLTASAATVIITDGENGGMFGYTTSIPAALFSIMEDGELYSGGIVISLHDLGGEA